MLHMTFKAAFFYSQSYVAVASLFAGLQQDAVLILTGSKCYKKYYY